MKPQTASKQTSSEEVRNLPGSCWGNLQYFFPKPSSWDRVLSALPPKNTISPFDLWASGFGPLGLAWAPIMYISLHVASGCTTDNLWATAYKYTALWIRVPHASCGKTKNTKSTVDRQISFLYRRRLGGTGRRRRSRWSRRRGSSGKWRGRSCRRSWRSSSEGCRSCRSSAASCGPSDARWSWKTQRSHSAMLRCSCVCRRNTFTQCPPAIRYHHNF